MRGEAPEEPGVVDSPVAALVQPLAVRQAVGEGEVERGGGAEAAGGVIVSIGNNPGRAEYFYDPATKKMVPIRDPKPGKVLLLDAPWPPQEPKPRKVGRKRRREQLFAESSGREVLAGLWCSACGTPAVRGRVAECPRGCGDFTGAYFVSGEAQAASIRGVPYLSPIRQPKE